jgi:single-strand DNA-binding protein
MSSFNRVILLGNCTRDPQTKSLPSGTSVTELGVACNRKFRTANGEDKEEVLFVDCTAFGKTADVIQQYFTKGKPIMIEGRLKYDSWEDKTSGTKRSKITVVIENFQFVGDRSGGGDNQDDGRSERDVDQTRNRLRGRQSVPDREVAFGGDEPAQFKDDDIPF